MSFAIALASAVRESNPPAPPPPPPGNGIIQGTRSLIGGGTLGGGTVQLYRTGSVFVGNAVPDGAGFYQFTALADDTYYVLDQPPAGYMVGAGQAGATTYTVTAQPSAVIVGGVGQTVDLLAQQMLYTNLFQSYADTAALRAQFPAGGVTLFPVDNNGQPPGANVFLDPVGGPTGGKAMRYDWPARPTSGCNNDITVKAAMRFNPVLSGASWFFRFRERMTNPWENGSINSCPAGFWEYKHLLIHMGGSAAYEMLMPQGKPGQNLFMNLTMLDGQGHSTSSALQGNQLVLGLPNVWPGAWRLWVLAVTGHGTTQPRMDLFIDGVLVKSLADGVPYTFLNSNTSFFDIGANLDSGPDNPQSRWFSEWSIGSTRPSNLP